MADDFDYDFSGVFPGDDQNVQTSQADLSAQAGVQTIDPGQDPSLLRVPLQAGQSPPAQRPQSPPQRPAPQPLQAPWTKNDDLAMARHNQDLATANGLFDDGELTEEQHQQALQQIMPRLDKLQQRQQAEQAKAAQAAQKSLMQQQSQQEAIQAENMKFRAGTFKDSLGEYTDPVTGRHTKYLPELDGKGNLTGWKLMEDPAHEAQLDRNAKLYSENSQADPSIAYAGGAGGVLPTDAQVQEKGPPPSTDVASVFDQADQALRDQQLPGGGAQAPNEERYTAPAGPANTMQVPDLDNLKTEAAQTGQPIPLEKLGQALRGGPSQSPLPTIQNALGEEIPSGGRPVQQRDMYGRPTGPPPEAPGTAPHKEAEFMRRAERAVPPVPPGLPPDQAAAFQLQRRQQVASMAHQMGESDRMDQQHKADLEEKRSAATDLAKQKALDLRAENAAKAQERREENAAKAEERRQAAKEKMEADRKITEQEDLRRFESHMESVRKERQDWEKNNPAKDLPDEYKNVAKTARERYQTSRQFISDLRSGKLDKPAPAPAPKDVTKKIQEDMEGEQMPALTAEQRAKPSRITPERIGELLPIVQNGLNAIGPSAGSFNQAADKHAIEMARRLGSLRDILQKAHGEGRNLTNGEYVDYWQHHNVLANVMKRGGQNANRLKLVKEE